LSTEAKKGCTRRIWYEVQKVGHTVQQRKPLALRSIMLAVEGKISA